MTASFTDVFEIHHHEKNILKEKKYIWIKCDLISRKRRVAYFLILGMSFFYDCIYRITHK